MSQPESILTGVTIDPTLALRLRTVAQQAATATEERDALIKRARDEGGSLREIGELVGLSHTQVNNIATRKPARKD